jgi:hypothetical protein
MGKITLSISQGMPPPLSPAGITLISALDTETDEIYEEFLEALAEIESNKLFPCMNCPKFVSQKGLD